MSNPKRTYPCDGENGTCPYNAQLAVSCIYHCGLGVDQPDKTEGEENQ